MKNNWKLFTVKHKPIFRKFNHTNGAVTIAIGRFRLKIWKWWL